MQLGVRKIKNVEEVEIPAASMQAAALRGFSAQQAGLLGGQPLVGFVTWGGRLPRVAMGTTIAGITTPAVKAMICTVVR
jgi:hypothetical protein